MKQEEKNFREQIASQKQSPIVNPVETNELSDQAARAHLDPLADTPNSF